MRIGKAFGEEQMVLSNSPGTSAVLPKAEGFDSLLPLRKVKSLKLERVFIIYKLRLIEFMRKVCKIDFFNSLTVCEDSKDFMKVKSEKLDDTRYKTDDITWFS